MYNEILKQGCISEYVDDKPVGAPRKQEPSTFSEKQKNIESFLKAHPEYVGCEENTRFVIQKPK